MAQTKTDPAPLQGSVDPTSDREKARLLDDDEVAELEAEQAALEKDKAAKAAKETQ